MEGKKRITRTYTPEFKLEAVRLSQQPSNTVTGVARDLESRRCLPSRKLASESSSVNSRSPSRSVTSSEKGLR